MKTAEVDAPPSSKVDEAPADILLGDNTADVTSEVGKKTDTYESREGSVTEAGWLPIESVSGGGEIGYQRRV